jgi:TPR repeat protein
MDNIVIAMDYWKPLLKKADCDAQYRVGLVYFMGINNLYQKSASGMSFLMLQSGVLAQ